MRDAQRRDEKEILRRWLCAGLQKPGKSATELAKKLGVPPSRVSDAKIGRRRLKGPELRLIAEYLQEPLPSEAVDAEERFPLRLQVRVLSEALEWIADNSGDEFTRLKARYELQRAKSVRLGRAAFRE